MALKDLEGAVEGRRGRDPCHIGIGEDGADEGAVGVEDGAGIEAPGSAG